MSEIYKKVGDDLEVTVTSKRIVTELELLEQKQRLVNDKSQAEEDAVKIQGRIDEVDAKLVVVNKI